MGEEGSNQSSMLGELKLKQYARLSKNLVFCFSISFIF